jgi:hypothetical protein
MSRRAAQSGAHPAGAAVIIILVGKVHMKDALKLVKVSQRSTAVVKDEVLGKSGRAYLKGLVKDPKAALAFFQRAGILDKRAKLTKNYR